MDRPDRATYWVLPGGHADPEDQNIEAARTGPEFGEPGRGTYQLEQISLTAAGLDAIDLKPPAVAGLLRDAVASGRDLFTLPDLRSTPADEQFAV